MSQLRDEYKEFIDRETVVIVVGPEKPGSFRNFWTKNKLPFIGLPDPKHTVLKLYGQQIKMFKFGRMPAQAIIDKSGVVNYVHYGKSMSDIPENAELLDIIDSLNTN